MNNGSCGQYGNIRSRTSRSLPTQSLAGRRDVPFSRSDIPPAEYKSSMQTSAMRTNNNHEHDHGHERTTWGLDGYPLAMVYSPIQGFKNLYNEETALARGTMFADLDLPFEGGRCGKDRC